MKSIKKDIKFSIRRKFLIVIISIIFFISISLILFFVLKSKEWLEQEIEKRGVSEVKSLAYDAKYGVLTENKRILEDLIKGRLRKPDIVYVKIIGEEGKILAEKRKVGYISFRKGNEETIELMEDVYRLSLFSENDKEIYEFVSPILSEKLLADENADQLESFIVMGEAYEDIKSLTSKIGTIKIGFSLQNVREQTDHILFVSILIILIVVAVSIITSIYFVNLLVKPIRKLAQTAKEVSNGDLTKTVNINSADEIGMLSANFNKMTTNLRNHIEALESLKNGLEKKVESRTEDLKQANIGLQKAYNELKKVDEMKTNFVSSVSHELRTPLTSVVGFANNAQKFYKTDILPLLSMDNNRVKNRSNRIEKNLSIIISEGERLTRLIDEVLDIAKMEAGKIEWNIKSVNVIEICKKALSSVDGYPKSSQVEVHFKAPDDNVSAVRADPDRLVQVITNIMSNALKFTEKGSITLKIVPKNENVEISISDTGKGIEGDKLSDVFEMFKQVGDTLTDKPKGTGLGLPICKEIVNHLGGNIWVESEIGKGSCFFFTLNYFTKMNK